VGQLKHYTFQLHLQSADMGWTFKWNIVPHKKCNLPISPAALDQITLQVKVLPEPGNHELIHVEGDMTTKRELNIEPRAEAFGVSGQLGSLRSEAERKSQAFTTFSLSAIIDGPQISWEWHKTEQSITLRDPDLTYQFAFKFEFQEPLDTSRSDANDDHGKGSSQQRDTLAIEISICDFTITFEPKHMLDGPRTLMSKSRALNSFRSDECHVDLEAGWPVSGVQHKGCGACGTGATTA
jgi:hypothetical protein